MTGSASAKTRNAVRDQERVRARASADARDGISLDVRSHKRVKGAVAFSVRDNLLLKESPMQVRPRAKTSASRREVLDKHQRSITLRKYAWVALRQQQRAGPRGEYPRAPKVVHVSHLTALSWHAQVNLGKGKPILNLVGRSRVTFTPTASK